MGASSREVTMPEMHVADMPAQLVAVVRRTVPMAELPGFYSDALGAVAGAVERAGGSLEGSAFGWYHGKPGDSVDVAGGFPVSGVAAGELDGGVVVLERPGGMAAVTVHEGSYDTVTETYRALEAWLRDRQLDAGDHNWEEYLADPETAPGPASWQTRIVWPLAE